MRSDVLASRGGPEQGRMRMPCIGISYICFTHLFTEVLWGVRLFCSR
jgi:hypothetical protein